MKVGILKLFVVIRGLGKRVSRLLVGGRVLTVEAERQRHGTGMARKKLVSLEMVVTE